MNNKEIKKQLALLCKRDGHVVYLKDELRTLFAKNTEETFNYTLRAFVEDETLLRISKGVYCYADRKSVAPDKIIGQAVAALRYGHLNYLSLESALSNYGIISQIPFRLTFMTTGRSGLVDCELGIFKFTHTSRDPLEILPGIYTGEDFHRASPQTALRDLRRVGRNVHLVDEDELADILTEYS